MNQQSNNQQQQITKISDQELAALLDASEDVATAVNTSVQNQSQQQQQQQSATSQQQQSSQSDNELDEEEEDEGEEEENNNQNSNNNQQQNSSSSTSSLDEELEESAGGNQNNSAANGKQNTGNFLSRLIKKGHLLAFDDDKPLEEYTDKEKADLVLANINRINTEAAEKAPIEFFESLPEELKVAAAYVQNGGNDLRGLFYSLAQREDTISLDETVPEDQETIVRQFLSTTGLNPAEIDEEIKSLLDRKELEKKALVYKPKLEAKIQENIRQKVENQKTIFKRQQEAVTAYRENIIKALKPGEISGVKLTAKDQNFLLDAMTKSSYQLQDGRNTNLLGHLLEKYNRIEPNPQLIMEAIMLLHDPKDYKKRLEESFKAKVKIDQFKDLKTSSGNKKSSGMLPTHGTKNDFNKQQRIERPAQLF